MIGVILAAFLAQGAQACPQFFPAGQPPQVQSVRMICFDGYALAHAAAMRGPAWSAEHLTAAGVAQALAAKRAGDFHPEPLLPKAERAELGDYRCAPYDRGHMTPVGDFGDAAEENDTFTLANMVPQVPTLNEGLWAGLEGAVRAWAQKDGDLYIVTGPIYAANPARLKGRVAIPAQTFKAVYDPATGQAAAYVARNDASGEYHVETIVTLAAEIGFDPFPGLAPDVKSALTSLPAPLKGNAQLKPRACH
jgi:endonuclease G